MDDTQGALSADIHLLGDLLGGVIRRLAGEAAFARVEDMRAAAKALRANPSVDEARRLRDRLASLPLSELRALTRAFTLYFDLVNLAEQQARVRELRERALRPGAGPLEETPAQAFGRLREGGMTAEQLAALLGQALLCPVFTAHPSEARRRAILEKLLRVAERLDALDHCPPTPRERARAVAAIEEEVESLWLTPLVRSARPTVLDEVRHGLEVVEGSLFTVVPRFYRDLEAGLRAAFPGWAGPVPPLLTFGSWIGGDRDGNPYVTHDVTGRTLRLQQEVLLRHYRDRAEDLWGRLSHSAALAPPSPELLRSLEEDATRFGEEALGPAGEPYRRKCRAIAGRLDRTLAHVRAAEPRWGDDPTPPPAGVYLGREALLRDLRLLADSLRRNGATAGASGAVQDFIRLAEVFGLHLLKLDVRQHSRRHGEALAEVLAWAGVCPDYLALEPHERLAVLARELEGARPLVPARLPFSDATAEVVQTFRTVAAALERQCPEAVDTYIISMATEPAHLLEVLLLAREARLFDPAAGVSRLNVVPLFETLDALRGAVGILNGALACPAYRRHLALRGGLQEVMVGYSDSNKESGFLQSLWALYRAQVDVAAAGRRAGVRVQFFHGRGGAIGRGGGPAGRAIGALPPGTVGGRIRLTEQGEVIADCYAHESIAERHLGQLAHAALLASAPAAAGVPEPGWEEAAEQTAAVARRHYRALVYETPGFLDYFTQATPIQELAELKIGSRPARRGPAAGVEGLRAIPWVFSWMQSRHALPGWYGLGSALEEYAGRAGGLATLRAMYEGWPFWRAALDNAQAVLLRADMVIARLYADLVDDQELAGRVFGRVEAEYRRTVEWICRVTGQAALLEHAPALRLAAERRNPYVDPLSFIQMALLRRLRAGEGPQEEVLLGVLESVNGVAAGLQNTG